jgi:chromosome segregation ATPase
MANKTPAAQGDLVNLEQATSEPLETGLSASSGESILNAAEVFQQQLEQMTAWKQKLGQQMELLRRDGLKLMERQKAIAQEKQLITQDRAALEKHREEIHRSQQELNGENARLQKLAADLDVTQQQLAELQKEREQAEKVIAARESKLQELEAQHFIEDVRLKESVEQLEIERRRLHELQRQSAQDRENIARQIKELEARAAALTEQNRQMGGREEQLNAARKELEDAQAELRKQQEETSAREKALAEKIVAAEADLQARAARALAEEQRVVSERQTLAKQRQEHQKRVELFEQEQAEQLDTLSKQTKRITERRTQVEEAEANLEHALAERIATATQSLRDELAKFQNGQSGRVTELEKQLAATEASARTLEQKEKSLEQELTATRAQIEKLNEELRNAAATADKISAERSTLANQLAEQMEQYKRESKKWEKSLAEAEQAGEGKSSEKAQAQLQASREKIDALKQQVKQVQQAKDDLEFQLEVRAEEAAKAIEVERAQLRKQIELRNEEITELKQRLSVEGSSPTDSVAAQELAGQVQILEQERNSLAAQLQALQESLNHQQNEAQTTRTVLEGMVMELEQKLSAFEAEKAQWKSAPHGSGAGNQGAGDDPGGGGQKQTSWQRQRLLRQAKALRTFRQQIQETQRSLEKGRAEIAQQRDQMRVRRDNLEQVKRLLEKQEMVMARKLADHNAIKTVCAAGIFVIMVFASVFFGVYRFVHPVYRGQSVVQLAPPPELKGAELDAWMNKQMAFLRSPEVAGGAWKVLRSPEEHYSMHDVREEWANSLGENLSLKVDTGAKTVQVTYAGQDPEGVSQVCNAIAASYITPGSRESTDETRNYGLGAQVVAKAAPPAYPVEDNRLMTSLIIVAVTLLVSVIFVMIFRHIVARQLREIDDMTDGDRMLDQGDESPEPAV